MEFGDIIYLILILLFAILGFSNESRKNKKLQQESEKDFTHTSDDKDDEPRLRHLPGDLPPVPAHQAQMSIRPEFRSSLDLVTDFEGASSLKGSLFVYDADASFAQESPQADGLTGETSAFDQRSFIHPLLVELTGEGAVEALKKGLIYGEIMQRKY